MVRRICSIVVLLAAVALAQEPASQSLALQNAGHISGRTYSNDALGFSIEFPAKWTIEDAGQMERTAEAGHRAVYGRDPDAEEEHEQAEKVVVRLAAASPPQMAAHADPRGVQIIVVPRSNLSPEEQKDFTAATVLENPALIGASLGEPKQVKIGNTEFTTVGSQVGTVNVGGQSVGVYLAMYALIRGENALVFGITASDEKEAAEVAKALETLHFTSSK